MLHVTHKSSSQPTMATHLTIGEDVTVGHKVMLHGCTIGNRVLVGMGSILLGWRDSRRRCDDWRGQPGTHRINAWRAATCTLGSPVKADPPPK